jgi:hypothetical protein
MERSLEQNQQSIALNMGQVAIAGRNAKTAEDTLGEIKKGGTDTHDLAVAAKDQAAAAKLQVGEMKKQETQTHQLAVQAGKQAEAAKLQADNTREALKHSDDAFQISEKPYVVLGRKDGVIGELRDAKGTSDSPGIDIYLQNSGHLPALNVCVSVQVSPDPSIGAQQFYENNSLTRLKDQSGPMRYHVMSEGNCADIAGDSVARHYVAKPFNQATLDRIRAAPLPIPLFVSTFVQYCTPFGEYRCVQNLLKYEKAPLMDSCLSAKTMLVLTSTGVLRNSSESAPRRNMCIRATNPVKPSSAVRMRIVHTLRNKTPKLKPSKSLEGLHARQLG